MDVFVCACCHGTASVNPRIKNQRFCQRSDCQRARKNIWQKQKLRCDPDYAANQKDCQQSWRRRHADYWRRWRKKHPQYVLHNRLRQRQRNQRRSIAKMDALTPKKRVVSGCYFLIPEMSAAALIAKMDASIQKVHLISDG